MRCALAVVGWRVPRLAWQPPEEACVRVSCVRRQPTNQAILLQPFVFLSWLHTLCTRYHRCCDPWASAPVLLLPGIPTPVPPPMCRPLSFFKLRECPRRCAAPPLRRPDSGPADPSRLDGRDDDDAQVRSSAAGAWLGGTARPTSSAGLSGAASRCRCASSASASVSSRTSGTARARSRGARRRWLRVMTARHSKGRSSTGPANRVSVRGDTVSPRTWTSDGSRAATAFNSPCRTALSRQHTTP